MGLFNLEGMVQNIADAYIDIVARSKVSSPSNGSVVYCDLFGGYAEHSGVYIGNNLIVHLDADGLVDLVSPKEFMARLGGINPASSIYVSCNRGVPVGSHEIVKRALSKVGSTRSYSLIFDNCHQFTAGCLTGNFENSCNFMLLLKEEVKKGINGTEWKVWDI